MTNHAQVLLCIARDPSGYISRERIGRRNRYGFQPDLPMSDRLPRRQKLGDLLALIDQRPRA